MLHGGRFQIRPCAVEPVWLHATLCICVCVCVPVCVFRCSYAYLVRKYSRVNFSNACRVAKPVLANLCNARTQEHIVRAERTASCAFHLCM